MHFCYAFWIIFGLQLTFITRKITKKPKLKASKDLKRVVSYLDRVSECRFRYLLDSWHKRYEDFINKKTKDDSKRGWHYTHSNLEVHTRV